MKKKIIIILIAAVIVLIGAAVLLYFLFRPEKPLPDKEDVILSSLGITDDFEYFFRTAGATGDAIGFVTVTNVEEVQDIIEKYKVTDTTYIKITATVEEVTDQIEGDTVTIYLLGNKESFPSREEFKIGRSYLMRLESWVHESGIIYLVSPLQSTHYRLHDGNILFRESADSDNYQVLLTKDEFKEKYDDYFKAHPVNDTVKTAHLNEIRQTLAAYDYNNKELAYTLDAAAIAARKKLADSLALQE